MNYPTFEHFTENGLKEYNALTKSAASRPNRGGSNLHVLSAKYTTDASSVERDILAGTLPKGAVIYPHLCAQATSQDIGTTRAGIKLISMSGEVLWSYNDLSMSVGATGNGTRTYILSEPAFVVVVEKTESYNSNTETEVFIVYSIQNG